MVIAQINKIQWDSEDPATPCLIWPMMHDKFGPIPEAPCLQREAIEQAVKFCEQQIKELNEDASPPVSMGELDTMAEYFIIGYSAAKAGGIPPGVHSD